MTNRTQAVKCAEGEVGVYTKADKSVRPPAHAELQISSRQPLGARLP